MKPIFVFDGGVPALKRQTLTARRQRKLQSLDKAEVSRQRILSAYLQQQLQRHAKRALPPSLRMQARLGQISSNKSPSVSPKKRKPGSTTADDRSQDAVDEDLESFRAALVAKLEDDMDEVNPQHGTASDSDDEVNPQTYHYGVDYSENFGVIQAPEFDTLPLETQHEILFEMQESRKMNSWGKFDKMPKDLSKFSNFQMDRLVKRRTLQKKIQSVQQEMGQRHIHVQNLDDLLKMDYDFAKKDVVGSRDDGFVLIKSQEPQKGKKEDVPKPGTSKSAENTVPEVITIDDFVEDNSSDEDRQKDFPATGIPPADSRKSAQGDSEKKKRSTASDEEAEDLKLAIQLSLVESGKLERESATSETDPAAKQSSGSGSEPSIHQISSQPESNSEPHHTRNEIKEGEIEHKDSANDNALLLNIQSSQMSHCAKFLDTIGFHVPLPTVVEKVGGQRSSTIVTQSIPEKSLNAQSALLSSAAEAEPEKKPVETSSSDDDDDEFEEVEEISPGMPSFVEKSSSLGKRETVATIDLTAIQSSSLDQSDDLFADIFSKDVESLKEEPEAARQEVLVTETCKDEMEHDIFMDSNNAGSSSFEQNEHTLQEVVTKWDSDSEIEADLMEMVLAESVETAKAEKTLSPSEQRASTSSAAKPIDSRFSEEQGGFSTNPTTADVPGPVKLITAEYMQAQVAS